jgi:hypothetical protein
VRLAARDRTDAAIASPKPRLFASTSSGVDDYDAAAMFSLATATVPRYYNGSQG